MDTQQVENKIKSNGKWASAEARDAGREVSAQSQDLLATIQDGISEILNNLPKYAQTGTKQATDLAKKYPVQAAVGGLVIGMLLGARFFRARQA